MAKSPTSGTPEPAPSFEQALERLEVIVQELEGGSLTLEQSIERYEEGVRLSRGLTRTLDEAEKRIERLTADEEDVPADAPVERELASAESVPRTRPRAPAADEPPGPDELPF